MWLFVMIKPNSAGCPVDKTNLDEEVGASPSRRSDVGNTSLKGSRTAVDLNLTSLALHLLCKHSLALFSYLNPPTN